MIDDPPAWKQVNVAFPDWGQAERTAIAHLAPHLAAAETARTVDAWFFIRKRPCWRVRYLPSKYLQTPARAGDWLARHLNELTAGREISGWASAVYEPETRAFGGARAMATAHRLFHLDSRCLLAYLRDDHATGSEHRREISVMLCSILMRAAGQDWYEQGDIWARVASHRQPCPNPDPGRLAAFQARVRRLMTVDAESQMRDAAPLARIAPWADAYAAAGRDLAALAAAGALHRGLREILAHHVIFAWNRLGLPYPAQAILAATASTVVFGPDPAAGSPAQE